jgi:hypothetical protein
LNLKSNSRILQPWQAFSKLFGDELKAKFDNEWKEYQEANPASETSNLNARQARKARFNFHNKKMQEWYEEATIEKKKKVEDFRQKKDDSGEDGDDPNRLFQE